MSTQNRINLRQILLIFIVVIVFQAELRSQDILPPVLKWKGKSMDLIVKKDNPWITPAEKTDFQNSPGYSETMEWLDKLTQSAHALKMISIGKSANDRSINMVIASSDAVFDQEALRKSSKPLLLIQAGIHSGEIDGKDAGMMLLRDIAFGRKKDLLRNVNLLFIPILNVDGHERSSLYGRINQRGPANVGWRTNARNLNLNRDYTKLDTEEIQAAVKVMNAYQPDLYLDIHVTDGADYQYDITYGFIEPHGYSPSISKWLTHRLKPVVDKHLKDNGHIPGPLVFAANDRDFTEGNTEYPAIPRFSNAYGDVRHLPSILIENHSLKPFKQRVLGTYVFLEAVIELLSKEGNSLRGAIREDNIMEKDSVTLTFKKSKAVDKMTLLGIESRIQKSSVTNKDYVEWLGKPVTQEIPFIRFNEPDKKIKRPKSYWIPSTYKDVIERLRLHGIAMEILNEQTEREVSMYRISDYQLNKQPFEGHVGVTGKAVIEKRKEIFYPGSARIDTHQPLGDLAVLLLEPDSPDSFFQWGFFLEIFDRTEYAEPYVMEPLARQMLAKDEKLRLEFESKKSADADFANDAEAIYHWFYERTPFYDERWLLYPVGMEY